MGSGGGVATIVRPIHATIKRNTYTMIRTGTINAQSLKGLPNKTHSLGDRKSHQKYIIMASMLKNRRSPPKVLSRKSVT